MIVHGLCTIGMAPAACCGLEITLGLTPASVSAVSSRRSRFVVMITLTYPSATSRAIAWCALVGIFKPSSCSCGVGSKNSDNRLNRAGLRRSQFLDDRGVVGLTAKLLAVPGDWIVPRVLVAQQGQPPDQLNHHPPAAWHSGADADAGSQQQSERSGSGMDTRGERHHRVGGHAVNLSLGRYTGCAPLLSPAFGSGCR